MGAQCEVLLACLLACIAAGLAVGRGGRGDNLVFGMGVGMEMGIRMCDVDVGLDWIERAECGVRGRVGGGVHVGGEEGGVWTGGFGRAWRAVRCMVRSFVRSFVGLDEMRFPARGSCGGDERSRLVFSRWVGNYAMLFTAAGEPWYRR